MMTDKDIIGIMRIELIKLKRKLRCDTMLYEDKVYGITKKDLKETENKIKAYETVLKTFSS